MMKYAAPLRCQLARLRAAFSEATDPITGDHLSAGEHVSWMIQHRMRRWSFLGVITLVTVLCWTTRNADVLTWWNLGASYAALVIEGVTAMALIQQTLRDAVVSRAVRQMESEHGELLKAIHARLCETSAVPAPSEVPVAPATVPVAPPAPPTAPQQHEQPASTLHVHAPRPHEVHNAKEVHAAERAAGGFNAWLAVHASAIMGSMWCFYAFTVLAFTGFPGIPWVSCSPQAFTAWLSSQTIQLVALPLLGAGQIVIGRAAQIQSDEQFKATKNTEHMDEQMMQHLDAQDAQILAQGARIEQLEEINRQQLALLLQLVGGTPPSTPASVPARKLRTSKAALQEGTPAR